MSWHTVILITIIVLLTAVSSGEWGLRHERLCDATVTPEHIVMKTCTDGVQW